MRATFDALEIWLATTWDVFGMYKTKPQLSEPSTVSRNVRKCPCPTDHVEHQMTGKRMSTLGGSKNGAGRAPEANEDHLSHAKNGLWLFR